MPQVRFQDLHQDLRNQLIRLNCGMLNIDHIQQYDFEQFWDVYLRNGKRFKLQYSNRYNAWYAQAKDFNGGECCPLTDTNERLFILFIFADMKKVRKANGTKNKQGDLFNINPAPPTMEEWERLQRLKTTLEARSWNGRKQSSGIKKVLDLLQYLQPPIAFGPLEKVTCPRCNGLKVFPEFKHVRYGICHKCLGAGVI